ncbi:MAG: hypothetical protein J6P21_00930 [Clostridia bacterium]|nr:hypothetical protein [Clostridia bacterium]
MTTDDFKIKFDKLIKILTTDENKAKEFSDINTVDESYSFACKLVGDMDKKLYYQAVNNFINNQDEENNNKNSKKIESVSGGFNIPERKVLNLSFLSKN